MAIAIRPEHVPEGEAALSHDLRNSVAALRVIVEGLRDGVVKATPESGILDQMMLHVRLLSDLLDEQRDPGESCQESTTPARGSSRPCAPLFWRRPCRRLRPAGRAVSASRSSAFSGGLGLAIARTIVEAHGGALWAGSPRRGASVRFYLPATARVGA